MTWNFIILYRQTIHHLPAPQHLHGFNVASTLQIGDPSFIAHECRVTTVGDFRPADMAVGGQGAPLVPYLDRILLERHFVKTRRLGLLLNVGGISNISGYIPSSANSNENGAFIGFDCGPGTSYNYIMYTVNRCTLLFVLSHSYCGFTLAKQNLQLFFIQYEEKWHAWINI